MSCKYNNCKHCGYKSDCEIYKKIAELEKAYNETEELLDKQIEATYKVVEEKASLERWFSEAKDLIRNLLRVTYGEGWNYSLDWKVKAEDFLKECEK